MNYEYMTEEQQAHEDARLDSLNDDNKCMCGASLDNPTQDCYEHMTQGF